MGLGAYSHHMAREMVSSSEVSDAGRKGRPRERDAERTRADILETATRAFAQKGLNGARVDEIAASTGTSKRMIYYYFGSKEGLYEAVLAKCYAEIRKVEQEGSLLRLAPREALRQIVRGTLDYQSQDPNFIRLVTIENIQNARFLKEIDGIRELNRPIIEVLQQIIRRGEEEGVFRRDLDPVDLHWLISSFATFNIANDATFAFLFDEEEDFINRHRRRQRIAEEAVLRFCCLPDAL